MNVNQSLIFIKKFKHKKMKNLVTKYTFLIIYERLTDNRTEKSFNRTENRLFFWFGYGLDFRQTEIFG